MSAVRQLAGLSLPLLKEDFAFTTHNMSPCRCLGTDVREELVPIENRKRLNMEVSTQTLIQLLCPEQKRTKKNVCQGTGIIEKEQRRTEPNRLTNKKTRGKKKKKEYIQTVTGTSQAENLPKKKTSKNYKTFKVVCAVN